MNQIESPKNRILGSVAFLVSFALWICSMDMQSLSDTMVGVVISVIGAVFTFPFVAIGLVILCIPVRIVFSLFFALTGIGRGR